jgi:nucleotide-binding universal stress UspA family protein
MTEPTSSYTIQEALFDFRRARRRAILSEILGRFTGTEKELLSFEEVRKMLKTQGSLERGLQDIPLNAIIGSVNRYEDFTRNFLPRKNVQPQRWVKVELLANGSVGLPPIEVYQIGKAYFVIDGNHRVSVASGLGATLIQAYVHEVPTTVTLTPDDTMEQVLLKIEHAQFMEQTRLNCLRPQAQLYLTAAGQYHLLKEHIEVHRYYMGINLKRPVSESEAVAHWYDTVYLPIIEIIQRQGLPHEFPNRSAADLYLWIIEHRAILEEELQTPVAANWAALNLMTEYGHSRSIVFRLGSRIRNALLPDSFKGGPTPGIWRKEKQQLSPLQSSKSLIDETQDGFFADTIFNDILIPLSGSETGWIALEQALLIAGKEKSHLTGFHVLPAREKENLHSKQMREHFDQRCQVAGIKGKLVLSSGPVAHMIVERSQWNDLVVVNAAHPPSWIRRSKLGPCFRELVIRCPRPILAVPGKVSSLNRALLAYDGSPRAEEALFVATYLCGKWHIPLVVVSAIKEERNLAAIHQHTQEYLTRHGIEHQFLGCSGPIAQEILVTAEEQDCDWIIMGGYGEPPLVNFLLDNVVDQVLRSTLRPMLLCR